MMARSPFLKSGFSEPLAFDTKSVFIPSIFITLPYLALLDLIFASSHTMASEVPTSAASPQVENDYKEPVHDNVDIGDTAFVVPDRPAGWKWRARKIGPLTIPWYASPRFQLIMVSFVCFLCPGMFNALGGLGGGGKTDATLADNMVRTTHAYIYHLRFPYTVIFTMLTLIR